VRERLGPQFMVDKGYTDYAVAQEWTSWNFEWVRLTEGYGWLSMVVWALCWIIPFWVLLGQKPKMTKWIVGPVSAGVLLGLWLERNLLVWPSVVKGDMTAPLELIPLGIAAGFVGAFILVFLFYARVFPSLALAQES